MVKKHINLISVGLCTVGTVVSLIIAIYNENYHACAGWFTALAWIIMKTSYTFKFHVYNNSKDFIKSAQEGEAILSNLVDIVWGEAHEDESVPSTQLSREMIDKAIRISSENK